MLTLYIFYALVGLSFFGLGVVVYRKIPALRDLSREEMLILQRKKSFIQKIREINYKEHLLKLIIYLEKFLRRLKIMFLKMENLLGWCIKFLRSRSQLMTQKSKEWIRQRELLHRQKKESAEIEDDKEKISIKVNKKEEDRVEEEIIEEDDNLPISELKKPIQEEQRWIDLIVENPKNITAYKFLGLLYWRQHNYADAKASLEMAVKLGSKDLKVKEIIEDLVKMKIE